MSLKSILTGTYRCSIMLTVFISPLKGYAKKLEYIKEGQTKKEERKVGIHVQKFCLQFVK